MYSNSVNETENQNALSDFSIYSMPFLYHILKTCTVRYISEEK